MTTGFCTLWFSISLALKLFYYLRVIFYSFHPKLFFYLQKSLIKSSKNTFIEFILNHRVNITCKKRNELVILLGMNSFIMNSSGYEQFGDWVPLSLTFVEYPKGKNLWFLF